MGGASSYISILSIAAFLGLAWFATRASKALGVSSIVLEIATGVVLGPSIVGLVKEEYAVCQYKSRHDCTPPVDLVDKLNKGESINHVFDHFLDKEHCDRADYSGKVVSETEGATGDAAETEETTGGTTGDAVETEETRSIEIPEEATQVHVQNRRLATAKFESLDDCLIKSCLADVAAHCGEYPDFFTLIGHAGVALMIFESGMHFDFEKAKTVGAKACVVAVIGTVFPLITGMLLTAAYGYGLYPQGLAVGTALAPTSVGIALRLLGEARALKEDFGQAIITAAFVDDILSLIMFNVLFSIQGDFDIVKVAVFPVVGVVFMLLAMVLAVKFWPSFLNGTVMPRFPPSRAKEVLFFVMMLVLVAYGTITHFLGTHLWGCFIAGMSFACLGEDAHVHHIWVNQTKRWTSWMIRIFFCATVAFSIPVAKLLSFEAFWKGSLMGIGPCILTKVLCAPFMGSARWVIGWAMVGRAEFAYLIAQMASAANMINSDAFSIVIWALLYATVFAPFIFRLVLNKYVMANISLDQERKTEDRAELDLVEGTFGAVDSEKSKEPNKG